MTNKIKVGDEVLMPPYRGKVVEIDDHPLEYAMLKLEMLTAVGLQHVWVSARLAKKLLGQDCREYMEGKP